MVYSISCSIGTIRVVQYKRTAKPKMKCGFEPTLQFRANIVLNPARPTGRPAVTVTIAVASLFKKLSLKDTENNTILASLADVQPIVCRRPAGRSRTAVQQKSAVSQPERCSQRSAPEFFVFGNPPRSGQIKHCLRRKDKKLRMTTTVEGSTRKWSNWHATKREAFDHLLEAFTGSKNTERDCVVPALSQHSGDVSGVSIVHQIYGVYRDGKQMSDLFKLSSKAW